MNSLKEEYSFPEIKIEFFLSNDIITTSSVPDVGENEVPPTHW